MIKKVLVANRGEIAMRIFRTCRVMNIPTVAIYTHVDRGALHVRYAEEAYCISEDEADTSYLKPDLILEIAKKTGAAIHPGYGFLSENADFGRRGEVRPGHPRERRLRPPLRGGGRDLYRPERRCDREDGYQDRGS